LLVLVDNNNNDDDDDDDDDKGESHCQRTDEDQREGKQLIIADE
jgi:hypothetical protein